MWQLKHTSTHTRTIFKWWKMVPSLYRKYRLFLVPTITAVYKEFTWYFVHIKVILIKRVTNILACMSLIHNFHSPFAWHFNTRKYSVSCKHSFTRMLSKTVSPVGKASKNLPGLITWITCSLAYCWSKWLHDKKKSGSGYKGEGQINSNGSVTDQVCRKENHKTDPLQKNYEDTSGPCELS